MYVIQLPARSARALPGEVACCSAVWESEDCHLICNPEDVCGDVPHSDPQEHKYLHNVACHQSIIARCLKSIVQGIAEAKNAASKQDDVLPCVAKLPKEQTHHIQQQFSSR